MKIDIDWYRLHPFAVPHTDDKYPPYNLIKDTEGSYILEFAVSGFSEEELGIDLEKGVLTITGTTTTKKENSSYLYKGIGARNFQTRFQLADTVVVKDAELKHGILKISLENIIPENKKKISIPITTRDKVILKG